MHVFECIMHCKLLLNHLRSATSQVFMNVATGGFGTEVTVKTDPKMKQQLGGAAYIITGDALHW